MLCLGLLWCKDRVKTKINVVVNIISEYQGSNIKEITVFDPMLKEIFLTIQSISVIYNSITNQQRTNQLKLKHMRMRDR